MTLGIYCAGGFGGVTLGLAREVNEVAKRWDSICFIDDGKPERAGMPYEVVSFEAFCTHFSPVDAEIVVAAGEPRLREVLFAKVKERGYAMPNLIHPTAQGACYAQMGEGNIILNLSYLSAGGVKLGDNNIVMPFSQISHNNTIGNHCVIASSVTLSGTTLLEDRSYIGVGAKLREGIVVGHDAIVGMGAIVVKSVDAESVVMGIPAKETRKNTGKVFR